MEVLKNKKGATGASTQASNPDYSPNKFYCHQFYMYAYTYAVGKPCGAVANAGMPVSRTWMAGDPPPPSPAGSIWKQRIERPSVGGVSVGSRNGAPCRKVCVVNGQMT